MTRNKVRLPLPSVVIILSIGLVGVSLCDAQTTAAVLPAQHLFADPADPASASHGTTPNVEPPAASPDPEISPAVARELAAMKAEIEALRAELNNRDGATPAIVNAPAAVVNAPVSVSSGTESPAQADAAIEKPKPAEPFAYADWTWLNGTPRNKDVVWDSEFFTPEIRLDAHYVMDFDHPKDDTMGGSTEVFRSNEFEIEQISLGGNFHWKNVNARLLTMNGMFGVTTPRNDASPGRGQWDLRGAYKYFSEANAGYHFDVNHGRSVESQGHAGRRAAGRSGRSCGSPICRTSGQDS